MTNLHDLDVSLQLCSQKNPSAEQTLGLTMNFMLELSHQIRTWGLELGITMATLTNRNSEGFTSETTMNAKTCEQPE